MLDWLQQSPNFASKEPALQQLVLMTATLLRELGIPRANTPRRMERIALAFLAVANVQTMQHWQEIAQRSATHQLTTRQLISYMNAAFQEAISLGSYDDIRRQDLKPLLLAELVIPTAPQAARNSPIRAYRLNPDLAALLVHYQTPHWQTAVAEFQQQYPPLEQQLNPARLATPITVQLPNELQLALSIGQHNQLQKAIIEQFLPRFGQGAEVLYVGDTTNRMLYVQAEKLRALQFFELGHGELPDVVAYSRDRNWLFLIEAVYTTGVITPLRLQVLKHLLEQCRADCIYITAFLDRQTFRRFVADIAWETEVWIAQEPDHLVHFNGTKFLGPD